MISYSLSSSLLASAAARVAYVAGWCAHYRRADPNRPPGISSPIAGPRVALGCAFMPLPLHWRCRAVPRLPARLAPVTRAAAPPVGRPMSPGDITNLVLSDEVAFRVEFAARPPRTNYLYGAPSLTHSNSDRSMLQGGRRGERVADRSSIAASRRATASCSSPGRTGVRARPALLWTCDNSLRMCSTISSARSSRTSSAQLDYGALHTHYSAR